MRGNVNGFSQERIERLLNKLDMDVVIQVIPRRGARGKAGVRVKMLD